MNLSLESAIDSFTFTFFAPRGASVLHANEELKYNGFWSMQTKSTPSLPSKHSWSRRTCKMLRQNTLSRSRRFECEILYRKFTVLKVTP